MAQRPEEKIQVIPIDYIKLVDDMSDQAFQFCVDQLYPMCNYRVLQRDDIRRIDFKERLLGYNSTVPKDEKGKEQGALNYYLFVMRLYFDNFLKCKEGSKAEKYRTRAMELMDSALSENGTIEDVEDLVQIFIALFRSLDYDYDHIEKNLIEDLAFDIYKEDAELLKTIWEHNKLVPNGIIKKLGRSEKSRGAEYWKQNAIKLAYINNIIFLCRCLQNRGVFAVEDK